RRRRPARTASAQAHALRPAEESLEPLGDRGREAHHAAEDERDPVPRLPDEGVLHGNPRSATAARRPKEARRVDLVGHALRAQALRQGGSDRAPAPRRDRGLCRNRALQRPLGGNQWQGAHYHATVLRPSFCLSPYRADPSLLLRPHAAARSHHPALPPNLMESHNLALEYEGCSGGVEMVLRFSTEAHSVEDAVRRDAPIAAHLCYYIKEKDTPECV